MKPGKRRLRRDDTKLSLSPLSHASTPWWNASSIAYTGLNEVDVGTYWSSTQRKGSLSTRHLQLFVLDVAILYIYIYIYL